MTHLPHKLILKLSHKVPQYDKPIETVLLIFDIS